MSNELPGDSLAQSDDQAQQAHIEAFLQLLCGADGRMAVRALDDKKRPPGQGPGPVNRYITLEEYHKKLDWLGAEGRGVCAVINEPDAAQAQELQGNAGVTAAMIVAVRALFVDLDSDGAVKLARIQAEVAAGKAPRPTAIIETSHDKYHVYWFLDRPSASMVGRFREYQKALSNRYGGDPNIHDLPRIMRLPGTMHQKGDPRLVRIIEFSGERHEQAELVRFAGVAAAPWSGTAAETGAAKDTSTTTTTRTTKAKTKIPEGGRHAHLSKNVARLRHKGLGGDELREALHAVNEQECEPPKGAEEIEALCAWAEANITPETDEAGIKWAHTRRYGGARVPLGTGDNLAILLAHYGYAARYDEMRHEIELLKDGRVIGAGERAAAVLNIKDLAVQHSYPRHLVDDSLEKVAYGERYHPAADYIRGARWDGGRHIEALAGTLGTATDYPDGLAEVLLRRWMINAAAAAVERDGVVADSVLVLQGAQGLGKTTWLRNLAPRGMVCDGATVNPKDRDSLKNALSYWLVELGELDATFRVADIAALKAFLSRDRDEIFLRYSRTASVFPRRTAFCASVNRVDFLRDETGNRRFWPIRCVSIERGHGVDLAQAWAQALAIYQAEGIEAARLAPAESAMLREVNEAHEEANPYEELILRRYDWGCGKRDEWRTAGEVLHEVDEHARAGDMSALRGVSRALRKLTGQEPQKMRNRGRCFQLPPFRVPGASAFGEMRTRVETTEPNPEALAWVRKALGREPGEEG